MSLCAVVRRRSGGETLVAAAAATNALPPPSSLTPPLVSRVLVCILAIGVPRFSCHLSIRLPPQPPLLDNDRKNGSWQWAMARDSAEDNQDTNDKNRRTQ